MPKVLIHDLVFMNLRKLNSLLNALNIVALGCIIQCILKYDIKKDDFH